MCSDKMYYVSSGINLHRYGSDGDLNIESLSL